MTRIFTTPLGQPFAHQVVLGFKHRYAARPPHDLARTICLVGTSRMADALRHEFLKGGASFVPKFLLLGDLSALSPTPKPSNSASSLSRVFELMPAVETLIKHPDSILSGASTFAMAQSLFDLFEEMQSEGVDPQSLQSVNTVDAAGYWQAILAFLQIIEEHLLRDSTDTSSARQQRQLMQALLTKWQSEGITHPTYVIGSTGSQSITRAIMDHLAHAPDCGVILPAVDDTMDEQAWRNLAQSDTAHDHPQYRFARLFTDHNAFPQTLEPWAPTKTTDKSTTLSLALCPAPVTSSWRKMGPNLGPLTQIFTHTTLIEARTSDEEALSIALILKEAAQENTPTTFITPDRALVRRVSGFLDLWGIRPDDSAGTPLALSAPGRFLRHICDLLKGPLPPSGLFDLLKHPITHSHADRNEHLLMTRDLELALRRGKLAQLSPSAVDEWARARDTEFSLAWAHWLCRECLDTNAATASSTLATTHRHTAHRIAAGCRAEDPLGSTGELWRADAGHKANACLAQLEAAAPHMPPLSPSDYADVFTQLLAQEQVRSSILQSHSLRIWGAQEARALEDDQIILGGLNEGIWPSAPTPDPWLSRDMRAELGLLSPEQSIGLSAHDFQHAACFDRVILTRSTMDAESQTIPSRWLNRLVNLLEGLHPDLNPALDGPQTLSEMRERGLHWLTMARHWKKNGIQAQNSPAPRPSVSPPIASRPRKLSITEIKTLRRDPYAIYAKHVLGLRALDPLDKEEDFALRGTAYHAILQRCVQNRLASGPEILDMAQEILADLQPDPDQQLRWYISFEKNITAITTFLTQTYAAADKIFVEQTAQITLAELDFTLTGKIDRIDIAPDGHASIYDYKTNKLPSDKQQQKFDPQLYLSALMLEQGGVTGVTAHPVRTLGFIAILKDDNVISDHGPDQSAATLDNLTSLISRYQDRRQGYTPMSAMEKADSFSEFDGISRYGEWDLADEPQPIEIGGRDE